jgi:two-component system nitrogen regulation response regulator NtrX
MKNESDSNVDSSEHRDTPKKNPPRILIIDDDAEVRSLMSGVLSDEGYITYLAANEREALSQMKHNPIDLAFLDLWIKEDESGGFKILEKIKNINRELPIIIISGHGTIDIAINAVRLGAFDFIEKPFVIDRLLITCNRAIELYKLKTENIALKNEKLYSDVFCVGTSLFANSIKSTIEKIASSNSRVYIGSPVGIGVESIAYKIHSESSRRDKNFIYVNCIADESESFDIDLFGTGKSSGYLEKASEGTIFFGDIDKLSKNSQRKLLFFLQNGKYVSDNGTVYSEARIICSSTNDNIKKMIENGSFSSELFYRLKISEIIVPSIKDRREDIIPIINYYLERAEILFGLPPKKFTDDALAILQSYDWPGNVHQIKNTVESSLINASDINEAWINETHLPAELTSTTKDKFESLNIAKFILLPLKEAKDHFESDYLRTQVERFSGNISRTANFIGMERSALHRKLKNLNVQCKRKILKNRKAS